MYDLPIVNVPIDRVNRPGILLKYYKKVSKI